jgi:GntR family transcriptional repressor for pyruvate dehydrogenase complex
MFQASRIVIREALTTLAAKGIVSVWQGTGSTVNARQAWNTLDPEILLLLDGQDTFAQLQEVRRIIEPELAAMAATRITPEALEALRPLAELPINDTIEEHVEHDTSFHLAIARATGNTVLAIVLTSIGDLLRESRRRSFQVPGMLAQARDWHKIIFAALEKRDSEAARRAMVEHLSQVGQSLEDYETNHH